MKLNKDWNSSYVMKEVFDVTYLNCFTVLEIKQKLRPKKSIHPDMGQI